MVSGFRFYSSFFAWPGFYEFLWFLPEIRILFAIWHRTFSFNAKFSVYAILGRSTSRRNLKAGKKEKISILANIELPILFTRLFTQFLLRQIDKHLKSFGHSLASFSWSQSFVVLHTYQYISFQKRASEKKDQNAHFANVISIVYYYLPVFSSCFEAEEDQVLIWRPFEYFLNLQIKPRIQKFPNATLSFAYSKK